MHFFEKASFRKAILRITFATRLAHKGLDISKISKLIGHQDLRVAQKHYAHYSTENLSMGVKILDVDYY